MLGFGSNLELANVEPAAPGRVLKLVLVLPLVLFLFLIFSLNPWLFFFGHGSQHAAEGGRFHVVLPFYSLSKKF